ncbi:TDP-N-acetylfucosamine:lipid II N-acetylfucosaminyltransferase [Chryseobacterium sp. TY3]
MPNIIHICQDEKFINSGFNQFEKLHQNQNEIWVYDCPEKRLKHITVDISKIRFIENDSETYRLIPKDSIVVFHSLPNHVIPNLSYIDQSVRIIWCIFGFETYSDHTIYSVNKSFDSITKKITLTKKYSVKEDIKFVLFPYIRKFKKNLYLTIKERERLKKKEKLNNLKRVDYFATSFDEEKISQEKMLGFSRPLFNFWYYPVELILDLNQEVNYDKSKIMIGHSGYRNGNHLDVVNKIKNYSFVNEDIIIPISYGEKNYIDIIKPLITKNLPGVNFIEEFQSLDTYNNLLANVKIAIFNNRRQQALGNIIALVFLGAKVFLSEKNSFYHYLKRIGIKIFSYENDLNSKSIENGLSLEDISTNRQRLYEQLNETKLLMELKISINHV